MNLFPFSRWRAAKTLREIPVDGRLCPRCHYVVNPDRWSDHRRICEAIAAERAAMEATAEDADAYVRSLPRVR